MTWVKGQTTWSALPAKLTALIAGEVADDSAVVVDPADAWIREIGGSDLLRAPASEDVVLPESAMRMGYMSLYNAPIVAGGLSPYVQWFQTVARVTQIYTSNPATTAGRWFGVLTCTVVNSVAHDYSVARFAWMTRDADTGTIITNAAGIVPTVAGVITLANGLKIQITDPSGFVTLNVNWYRAFSTTYLGGVDYWPMYARRVAAHSFGVAPSALSGTDWDVVDIPCGYGGSNIPLSNAGGMLMGLGIKTNAGLTGDLYTVNLTVAGQKMRLVNSISQAGSVNLEIGGGGKVDTVYQNPTYRQLGGSIVGAWLRPFEVPASVLPGSAIQYWMSVKPDRIAIILNGDPGQSGRSTCNWIAKFDPYYPAIDLFPWLYGRTAAANITGSSGNLSVHYQYSLMSQFWRQDGSEGRDWQTKWMRTDWQAISETYSLQQLARHGGNAISDGPDLYALGWEEGNWQQENTYIISAPRMNKPHPIDQKWWMYGWVWTDYLPSISQTSGTTNMQANVPIDARIPRGETVDGCLYLPGDGWSTGDELTDTLTGKKYFLVAADYHGIAYRFEIAASVFAGGAAVLEE